MMKIKNSEETFRLGNQYQNSCIETDSNFKLQNTKFNVINSSEISKVLRELTQCIANDHELFTNNLKPVEISDHKSYKENDIESNKMYENPEMSQSELNSSSSSNSRLVGAESGSSSIAGKPLTGEKHICLQCGKQFNKRDFLQKHKIVHEIPRHKCVACDKSFVREDKLKRHFTSIHSKHRPHICDVCSKAFARKDKLKDHKKHHVTAGNSFQCADCQIPFVQKSDLNRHFRGIHKGETGVGINVPSKRFVKSKINEEIPHSVTVSKPDHQINNQPQPPESIESKPMMISNPFYPIPSSLLPLQNTSANTSGSGSAISDLSKPSPLIKSPTPQPPPPQSQPPSISFIPTLPLTVELNYPPPLCSALPSTPAPSSVSSVARDKDNLSVKTKSKKSPSKSKSKSKRNGNAEQTGAIERITGTNCVSADKYTPFSPCKNESITPTATGAGTAAGTTGATSNASLNCLVSQGANIYSHIPIIAPFQSPMISVFPTTHDFYSKNLNTSAKQPTNENSLFVNSPSLNHVYNDQISIDPLTSSTVPSSSHTNNPPVKPTYSLGTANNIAFAHQNLYQFQQNHLRYYSYFQPGSHFFGQHSTRPLSANIYPYMPF